MHTPYVLDLLVNRKSFAADAFGGNTEFKVRKESASTAALRRALCLDLQNTDHYAAMFWRLICANPDLCSSFSRHHPNARLNLYVPGLPRVQGAMLVPTPGGTAVVGKLATTWPLRSSAELRITGDSAVLVDESGEQPVMIRRGTARIKVEWPEGCGIKGDLFHPAWPTDTTVIFFYTPAGFPAALVKSAVAGSAEATALLRLHNRLGEFNAAAPARAAAIAASVLAEATHLLPEA